MGTINSISHLRLRARAVPAGLSFFSLRLDSIKMPVVSWPRWCRRPKRTWWCWGSTRKRRGCRPMGGAGEGLGYSPPSPTSTQQPLWALLSPKILAFFSGPFSRFLSKNYKKIMPASPANWWSLLCSINYQNSIECQGCPLNMVTKANIQLFLSL